MFLSVAQCVEPMTLLCRLKVKVILLLSLGFTLQFYARFISPEPLKRFSLNFTQMFLLVRQCAEPLTQLRILKVKVTLQGHGIYP